MAATLSPRGATLTCAIESDTDGTITTSDAYDNATNLDIGGRVQVKATTGGSGASAAGYIAVYFVASVDNGTTYDDSTVGRMELLGQFPAPANSTTYIASFKLPTLTRKFKIAVENRSGTTLSATAGDHHVKLELFAFA